MTGIDFIRMSLEMSRGWITGLAADMQDAPLTAPTPNGGNHPLWCVGHLAYSEASMINSLCKGEPNPLEDWKDLFNAGTQPSAEATDYPPYAELLAKAEEIRASTLEYLSTLTDADLDKPSHAEGEMKQWFGTIGSCFAAIPTHVGFHGGQIADSRRAAGRPPLMG